MLFNSLEFFIFFACVYATYGLLKHRGQNILLLIASYIFYSFWDWRFLSLIIISTLTDYICGLRIHQAPNPTRKKIWLTLSVTVNLGLLGFFKYFNFFSASLSTLCAQWGLPLDPFTTHIILPVGISFYTFQTLSYTIDVYREECPPTRRFLDFALYVAFFPQLVAGPIERAKHFLPQILHPRALSVSKFYEGAYLISWGLFEKLFISSNLAPIVDPIFAHPDDYQGGSTLVAVYAFAFLIFCDFDAYSNIARGVGKCLGFDIINNFNLPYWTTNPQDFWRRWHISLSSWLRDYLYIPLGGNRRGPLWTLRNLGLTMLLGGLWHGAAWTFVCWGAYHGLLLMIFHGGVDHLCIKTPRWRFVQSLLFFQLIACGWLLFRAPSISQALTMFHAILFHFTWDATAHALTLKALGFITPLLIIQWGQYKTKDLLFLTRQHWVLKTLIYAFLTYLTLKFGLMASEEFIYFQF